MSAALPLLITLHRLLGQPPFARLADLADQSPEPIPPALRKALKRPEAGSVSDLYVKLLLYDSVASGQFEVEMRAAGASEEDIVKALEAARHDASAFDDYLIEKKNALDTKFVRRFTQALVLAERRKRTGEIGLRVPAKSLIALCIIPLCRKGRTFPSAAEFYETVSNIVTIDEHSFRRILQQLGVKDRFSGQRRGRPPVKTPRVEERVADAA
jgi:hypothetical protein